MRRDEGGQMMLLAAVLLIIGFIALAGIVSIAQRLGEETEQEQSRNVLREAPPVADLMLNMTDQILKFRAPGSQPGQPGFDDLFQPAMRHVANVTAAHGFLFGWDEDCVGGQWQLWFTLADARVQVNVTVLPDADHGAVSCI